MFLVNCTNPFEPLIKYKLKTTCYLKDDFRSNYGDVDWGGRSHSCPSSAGESHTLCAVIHVCALIFQDTPFKKLLRAAWLSSKVSMRERCGTHCLLSSWESWRRLILSFSIGLYVLRTEQRPVEANRGQVRHVRLLEFSAFPILLYSCGLTKDNVLKGR